MSKVLKMKTNLSKYEVDDEVWIFSNWGLVPAKVRAIVTYKIPDGEPVQGIITQYVFDIKVAGQDKWVRHDFQYKVEEIFKSPKEAIEYIQGKFIETN